MERQIPPQPLRGQDARHSARVDCRPVAWSRVRSRGCHSDVTSATPPEAATAPTAATAIDSLVGLEQSGHFANAPIDAAVQATTSAARAGLSRRRDPSSEPPSQWPLVVNRLFERVDRPRVDGHRNGERARVEVDLGLLEQLFIEQQRDPEQPTERRKLAEGSARSFRATGHAFRVAPRGRPAGSSRAEGPPAFAPAPPGSQTRARRGPCGAGRWPWLAPRNGCRAPRDSHRRRPPPRAR
jgi:hypothetical protein